MSSRYSLEGGGLSAKERHKGQRDRLRLSVFRILGGVCVRCGIEDQRVFQIDHIYDDGHLDPKTWDQVRGLKDAIERPYRYQLLCANCHQIKTLFRDDF